MLKAYQDVLVQLFYFTYAILTLNILVLIVQS